MSLVLDAGALVALERGDAFVTALLKLEMSERRVPSTHGGVIAQVWRGGSGRQARLARLLPALRIVPLDDDLGRRAGVLLGAAGTADPIDAAVVLLAADGDSILTSDADDLEPLAIAAGLDVEIVAI